MITREFMWTLTERCQRMSSCSGAKHPRLSVCHRILFLFYFIFSAYISTGQIMGWGHKAIEIRCVDTGHLDGVFMHKKAQRLKFLCERNDKVWVFLYFIAFSSSEHSLYKIINSKTLNKLFSQFLDNLIISKRNNSQISRYSSHLQRVAAHARSILWLWIGQVWAIGKALQYFTAFNQWIAWISKTPWCPFSGYNNLVSFYLQ